MTLTPWMDPLEIEQLEWVLDAAQPKRCLEWGSGGSTALILKHPGVEQLVSIEHNLEWANRVLAEVNDPRLTVRYVPADVHDANEAPGSAWAARAETDLTLLRSYVACPTGIFDFVLVDGRARRFCLLRGFELLRPGGYMVLHDAQREEYRDVLRCLDAVRFEPWEQGQIAVMQK
jgi:predicted O-methyltransferase YrrM